MAPEEDGDQTRVSPSEYRDNLRQMIQLARASGAEVILGDLVFVGPVFTDDIAVVSQELSVPDVDGPAVLQTGLTALMNGTRFAEERAAADAFWEQEVTGYIGVYYSAAHYQRLQADPLWQALLQYVLIEPVHPNAFGHALLAEGFGEAVLEALP